jgi:hypothetical protein
MPRLPVRLTEEQKAWVEREAESRGCSQSEVVQQLVADACGDDDDELSLEERVSRLEQRFSAIQPDSVSESLANQDESARITSESVAESNANQPDSGADSEPNQFESIVDEWAIPGDSADEKRARASWLASTLSWIAGQDGVRKGDVVARWDEGTLGYETADGLWESLVKPRLDELVERGLVKKPHSRAYRWVGQ